MDNIPYAIIEWEIDEVGLECDLSDLDQIASFPAATTHVSRGSLYDEIIESSLMDDQEHYGENDYMYSLLLCEPSLTPTGNSLPFFDEDQDDLPDFSPVDDVWRIQDIMQTANC